MNTKSDQRFELRIPAQHKQALENLAKSKGISMASVITRYVERTAKREGLWNSAQ